VKILPERKKTLKKNDFILIAVILAAAIGFALFHFFSTPGERPIAVVSISGENKMEINLAKTEDKTFSLKQEYGVPVSLEVKDHKIRFVNVDCPDHICEATGFISRAGESAVCLPNKTAVVIREAK